MKTLAFFIVLLIATAAHAEEEHRKFYGPNKEYLRQCIVHQHGITDCYDKNGAHTGRTVTHSNGKETIREFFGKNLGKPIGREVITR